MIMSGKIIGLQRGKKIRTFDKGFKKRIDVASPKQSTKIIMYLGSFNVLHDMS
ncbi:MAG: hypothetical protein ACI90V_012243 [Bacillariaceae sp.]|jgi:hypothetical protein